MNQSDIDAFLARIEKVKNEPQRLERLQAVNFGWENTLGCLMEAYLKFSRFITINGDIVNSVAVVELEDIVSYYLRALEISKGKKSIELHVSISDNFLLEEFERVSSVFSTIMSFYSPKALRLGELENFMMNIEHRISMLIESCLQIERELKQDDRQLSML